MTYKDGNTTKCVCDNCDGDFEPDELYIYGSEHLCADCILKRYDTVEDIEDMMEAMYA